MIKQIILLIIFIFALTANAQAGTAILLFDPPQTNVDGLPMTDLVGYKTYWGTISLSYTNTLSVTRSLKPECQICITGNITATCGDVICITGLTNGVTYYFTVIAYDTSGNESSYASTCATTPDVSRTIPAATNPIGNINTTSMGSATRVDGYDLIKLSAQFGLSIQESSGQCTATNAIKWTTVGAEIIDLNGDGRIDGFDLIILSANFGRSQ